MKRTVALALLGMAAATSAFAQGHVAIGNYVSPYNSQVLWDSSTGKSGAVTLADAVEFRVYFGEGTITDDSLLEEGVTLAIDPAKDYLGGGWLQFTIQPLPGWAPGETYTFQVRALSGTTPNGLIDTVSSRSALWQEQASIVNSANPANPNVGGLGLTIFPTIIPEPTTLALAGLGAAAMLIFRRRA